MSSRNARIAAVIALALAGAVLVRLAASRQTEVGEQAPGAVPASRATAAPVVAAALRAEREALTPPARPAPVAPRAVARVRARFVDAAGAPLAGVDLSLARAPERAARSGIDGEVALAFEVPPGPGWWTFEARGAG